MRQWIIFQFTELNVQLLSVFELYLLYSNYQAIFRGRGIVYIKFDHSL